MSIEFTARCPECSRDALWRSSVGKNGNGVVYVIFCDCMAAAA